MFLINQIENNNENIIKFINSKCDFNQTITIMYPKIKLIEYINLEQLLTNSIYVPNLYLVKLSDDEIVLIDKYVHVAEGYIYNCEYGLKHLIVWKLIACSENLIDEYTEKNQLLMYNYKILQISAKVLKNKISIYGNINFAFSLIDKILHSRNKDFIENSIILSSEQHFNKYRTLPKNTINDFMDNVNDGCIIIINQYIDPILCVQLNKCNKMIIVYDTSIINTQINYNYTILFNDNISADNKFQLYNGNIASKFPLQLSIPTKILENIYKELIKKNMGLVINDSNMYYYNNN